jgi:uncharacterized membrane protein YoaK (UPF0700 family)
LAVLDLTTTALTMTLTGIAADLRASGDMIALSRRPIAVFSMLGGAAVGTVLDLHAGAKWALLVAVALAALVTTAADPQWSSTGSQGYRPHLKMWSVAPWNRTAIVRAWS